MIKDEDEGSDRVPGQQQTETGTTPPRYYRGLEWPKHFPMPPSTKCGATHPNTQTLISQRNEVELFCGDNLHFDLYRLLHPVSHSSTKYGSQTSGVKVEPINSDLLGSGKTFDSSHDSGSDSGQDTPEVEGDEVVPSSVDGEEETAGIHPLDPDDEQPVSFGCLNKDPMLTRLRNLSTTLSAHQVCPQLLWPHKSTSPALITTLHPFTTSYYIDISFTKQPNSPRKFTP